MPQDPACPDPPAAQAGLAGAARDAAVGTREGVAELRDFIRGQPITAALLLLGLGYLAGRVAGASHAAARR